MQYREIIGGSGIVILVTIPMPEERKGGSGCQEIAVWRKPSYRSCDPQLRDMISQLRTHKEGNLPIGQI